MIHESLVQSKHKDVAVTDPIDSDKKALKRLNCKKIAFVSKPKIQRRLIFSSNFVFKIWETSPKQAHLHPTTPSLLTFLIPNQQSKNPANVLFDAPPMSPPGYVKQASAGKRNPGGAKRRPLWLGPGCSPGFAYISLWACGQSVGSLLLPDWNVMKTFCYKTTKKAFLWERLTGPIFCFESLPATSAHNSATATTPHLQSPSLDHKTCWLAGHPIVQPSNCPTIQVFLNPDPSPPHLAHSCQPSHQTRPTYDQRSV